MPDIQKALDEIARVRSNIEKTRAGVSRSREKAREIIGPRDNAEGIGLAIIETSLRPISAIMDGLSANLDRIEAALRSP